MTRFRDLLDRHAGPVLFAVALVVLGGLAGAAGFVLQPAVSGSVGPGTVVIDPSLRPGDTVVDLPPLGQIRADTHRGPLGFAARLTRIDLDRAGLVARDRDPAGVLRDQVESDLRPLLMTLGRQTLLVAVIAGNAVALVLPRRRLRYAAGTLAGSLGFLVVSGVVTAMTFDPSSFDQPEFEGALSAAPDILNTVQRHVDDVAVVESRLEALSDRVVGLYRSVDGSAGSLPSDLVILHVSDLHSNPVGIQLVEEAAIRFDADAIIDTGDLTSFGADVEEAVVDRVSRIDTPYYVIPGNHDSPSIRRALVSAGVQVLDPGVIELGGLRVLGVDDPNFTADNRRSADVLASNLEAASAETRRLVLQHRPDLVAVHNPAQLGAAVGLFDVGLVGHRHRPGVDYEDGSVIVATGSAGATGVEALMTADDLPYEMQLLQFIDDRLVAIDRVAFEGTDGAFRLERVLIDNDAVYGYPGDEELEPFPSRLPGRRPPE